MELIFWALSVVCGGLVLILLEVVRVIWWKPSQLKKYFESQGIRGPPYRLLYGNSLEIAQMMNRENSKPMPVISHDIAPRILPHFHQWIKAYGQDFIFWFGPKARLHVCHPELAKEVLSTKSGQYEKIRLNPLANQLFSQGLVGLRGDKWVQHRRIIDPAFHVDILKSMVPTIATICVNMLEEWSKLLLSGTSEIDVLKEFENLTADIISHTAFGRSSEEGKDIFNMQAKQMVLTSQLFRSIYIPGFRFLPTRMNRQLWYLEKEIRRCLRQVIETREKTVCTEKSGSYGTDLLGLMMSANKEQITHDKKGNTTMSIEEIIDECKTFYFAGHETSSMLLTWTLILLGIHRDWQELARREVLEVCEKNSYPDAGSIDRLKIVGMILYEALRLYPPAVFLRRQTYKPMKLGRVSIPAGIELQIPMLLIHHDPTLWGTDVNDFKPERFREGIAKAAKHPMAFMPFGLGPRICVGQNFALLEAKVVLAMILQRFSFVISPHYVHAPTLLITLRPQHGAQIILHMH